MSGGYDTMRVTAAMPFPANLRRILLIKPSSLGDIIHALPTFDALRRRFPEAELSWFVKAEWAGILERVIGLDRVWPVGRGLSAWLREIGRLRDHRFDLVVDLQGLFRSGAAAWLSGCGLRMGFANGREGSALCYTHRIAVPDPDLHAVERYLLVAQALGCPAAVPAFPLHPLEADRGMVHTLLGRHGVRAGTQWVGLHVSARWPTKRWPLASFVAVARALREDGLQVVVIGATSERPEAQEVAAATGAIDLTGETSLAVLPAVLERAACLVTNDSGPMHIAAAMGTPVVALFGPTSPVRTGPYGAGHLVMRTALPCQPCFSRSCRNQVPLECLTSIDPEQVIHAVRAAVVPPAGVRPS